MYQLRFAPIIRVSTEKQEKRRESLHNQTEEIRQYVSNLGGTIPESCWRYTDRESATPEKERILLNNLLADSGKDIFDAVIVCDAGRWSRDNLKSKTGLNILRQNGIKFFVGTTQYDLFKPAANLFLGMSAEIGAFQAAERKRRSMEKRIERARKGIPTSGKLPYGRLFDKKTGSWSLDREKKRIIQQAAQRYIDGENIKEIAASMGFVRSTLYHILTTNSGSDWEIRFRSKDLNIHETVTMKVPPLLSPETIEKIHQRVIINTNSRRGNRKWFFLLSGFVFCNKCGFRFNVYKNQRDRRYYRHRVNEHNKKCQVRNVIPAPDLENAVILNLLHTLGDPERAGQAMQGATSDIKRIQVLQRELKQLKLELKDMEKKKKRVVDAVAAGTLKPVETTRTMNDLREKTRAKENRLQSIEGELESLPDPDQIKQARKLSADMAQSVAQNPKLIFERDNQWKRSLVEKVFAGKDRVGKPLGIYVEHVDEKWQYEIRGAFETGVRNLPLTDWELIAYFNIKTDGQALDKELSDIRSKLVSISYMKHYL